MNKSYLLKHLGKKQALFLIIILSASFIKVAEMAFDKFQDIGFFVE